MQSANVTIKISFLFPLPYLRTVLIGTPILRWILATVLFSPVVFNRRTKKTQFLFQNAMDFAILLSSFHLLFVFTVELCQLSKMLPNQNRFHASSTDENKINIFLNIPLRWCSHEPRRTRTD